MVRVSVPDSRGAVPELAVMMVHCQGQIASGTKTKMVARITALIATTKPARSLAPAHSDCTVYY
jgi:hypothetical protein